MAAREHAEAVAQRALGLGRRVVALLRSSRVARLRVEIALAVCFVACGRASPSANAPDTATPASGVHVAIEAGADAGTPEHAELWARAADGTEEDLARLAQAEGTAGLAAGASTPATRLLAARAMAHTRGQAGLAWLAETAASDQVELAQEAARSAVALGARGRDQNDLEDIDELRAGCAGFVAIAKDAKRDRAVRIDAVRTLRLFADRGCAKAQDIPTDLDLKP